MSFLEIDGSVLEGGGQILRISVALSAILGIPIRVFKIRAGRSKPGLAAQHQKGIQLVGEMCQAKMSGVEIGSTEIEFHPHQLRGGTYKADTQTAGSVGLLMQVAVPCALMADGPVKLHLFGGTNADLAPQIDYLTDVFLPLLNKFGATFNCEVYTRGYYPRGGGHVAVTVPGLDGAALTAVRPAGPPAHPAGPPAHHGPVRGRCFVAGELPIAIAHEMCAGATEVLRALACPIYIDCYKESPQVARDNASGIIITCDTSMGYVLGADAMGKSKAGRGRGGRGQGRGRGAGRGRGRGAGWGAGGGAGWSAGGGEEAREVGRDAARRLAACVRDGLCLDQHAQDQVIILMALAAGQSELHVGELTLHTRTAIHVAQTIAKVKFSVEERSHYNVLRCEGLGRRGLRHDGFSTTTP